MTAGGEVRFGVDDNNRILRSVNFGAAANDAGKKAPWF